jgi:D-glycero-D-manno-heptose 1,7-bisphosphate phosphatase
MKKNQAVFLDRDGVINRAYLKNGKPHPPTNLSELEILPGVAESLEKLYVLGFKVIVITNQPDVARGVTEKIVVEKINAFLYENLKIDEFKVCYHDDSDFCNCRKPNPGALIEASNQYLIDLHSSYMVGDRWKDILAGQRAGCKTIFIQYNYKEMQPEYPSYIVKNLTEAVEIIIGEIRCKK